MQEHVIEFKYYLTSEKMVSKNTVLSYTKDIENYLNYLESYQLIDDVSLIKAENITAYLAFLKKYHYSSTSMSRALSSIKSFHKFLLKEKLYAVILIYDLALLFIDNISLKDNLLETKTSFTIFSSKLW